MMTIEGTMEAARRFKGSPVNGFKTTVQEESSISNAISWVNCSETWGWQHCPKERHKGRGRRAVHALACKPPEVEVT